MYFVTSIKRLYYLCVLFSRNFAHRNFRVSKKKQNNCNFAEKISRLTKQPEFRGIKFCDLAKFKFIYLKKGLGGAIKGQTSLLTQLFFAFTSAFVNLGKWKLAELNYVVRSAI